jgi:cob(I)alamin adenosyltransferase
LFFGFHGFIIPLGGNISYGLKLMKPTGHEKEFHRKKSIFEHSGYNLVMPKFYTRKGDDGSTGFLGQGRLPKHHPRIEILGSLDEASAFLGLARSFSQVSTIRSILLEVQNDLVQMMAEIASSPDNSEHFQALGPDRLEWLESSINALSTKVSDPGQFILPGGSTSSAALSVARTIVRRAERRVVGLFDSEGSSNPTIISYLNRLSSLCFVMELLDNQSSGHKITLAKK